MTKSLQGPDRSRDLSQPLEKLGPDEAMKVRSDYLRGSIDEGLLDALTGAVSGEDSAKLMKFHGIYVQDDRDLREERARQRLEPAYEFMVRIRVPGGVVSSQQWLALDERALARGRELYRNSVVNSAGEPQQELAYES